jgi:hypothetical protein
VARSKGTALPSPLEGEGGLRVSEGRMRGCRASIDAVDMAFPSVPFIIPVTPRNLQLTSIELYSIQLMLTAFSRVVSAKSKHKQGE